MVLGGLWNVILWELLELVGCIAHLTLIKWSHCWMSVARAAWCGVMTLLDLFWRGCERGATLQYLHACEVPPMQNCLTSTTSCDREFHSELSLHTLVFLASFPLVSFSLGLVLWNVHETFFTLFLSRSCLYIFLSNNVSLWSLLNYIYSLCWLF